MSVQRKCMFGNIEPAVFRHLLLALFDFVIKELFDPPAIEADEMVVVRAFVQLEHRLACLEMISMEQAGLLELRQYAIHGSETDIHVLGEENLVHVLGAQVTH